jgi:multidrug resistance protein, MATE family
MRGGGYRLEFRELFRLGVPLGIAQAGNQLMGLVDVAVLGRLGAREMAATGLGNAIFFAISIIGMGIMFGVDPLISQAVGAGDRTRARRTMWQGAWLGIAVAAALSVIMIIAAFALPLFGVQQELVAPAQIYVLIRVIGLAPTNLFFVLRSYLQAQGMTRPMLFAMIAANVFNLGTDIYLVFGGSVLPAWTGPLRLMPPLGVAGAAIATVLCTLLQMVMLIRAVRRIEVPGPVDRRWNRADINQAFRVGFPVGLQMGAEVGIFALVGVLAGRLGTLHLAAHQVAIGLASFTYTFALGIASAGTVRVGLAIGARDAIATRIAGRAAIAGGALVMAINALMFTFAPRPLARLITDQTDVIAAAIPLMFVAAVFQLSDGIQGVGAGVLRGAGDTKFTFYANVLGHWLIGFPVALLLGFQQGLGIVGLWWGLCAGLTVVAALLFVRFERLSSTTIEPLAHRHG